MRGRGLFNARLALLGATLAFLASANAQIHLLSDDVRRAALENEAQIEYATCVAENFFSDVYFDLEKLF